MPLIHEAVSPLPLLTDESVGVWLDLQSRQTHPATGLFSLTTPSPKHGEVLIVDAPNRVSYTWASGGEKHTVTWTLQDLGDGKVNLHLEQTGFANAQGLEGARYGWGKWCGELKKVLA
ncbi:SRPBCC family protein [Paenibacillus agricola]|uniref:SRPBCC family protein n=1 Tax=Paenibacillus agricola TaxID=2716264 RepID=UPI001A9D1F86|nr:SRPBCC domain-containing protein [Paenibacillus agricola]